MTREKRGGRLPWSSRRLVLVVAGTLVSTGCGGAFLPDFATTFRPSTSPWAIVLYMDASGDLRAQAAADLSAMEAVGLSGTGITVLALVDDGTRARLYEVADDPAGPSPTVSSIPIAVPALGIDPAGPDVTLDMSDPATLSELLSFVEEAYRPERRALILWGAGSGYHIAAFLSPALRGTMLDVIGFDASFSASVEVAWELRSSARLMVASQAIVSEAGWDYGGALRRFVDSDRAAGSLVDAIVAACVAAGDSVRTTISAIDLTRLAPVMAALNDLSDALYHGIADAAARDSMRSSLFYDVESFYATPGDLSIDVGELGVIVRRDHGLAEAEAAALAHAVRSAVRSNHRGSRHPAASGMSIHLIPLRADGTAGCGHASRYFRGSPGSAPLAFVSDSTWVPVYPAGPGLLYRLFYEVM